MESPKLPITDLTDRDRLISELVHLPLPHQSRKLLRAVIELGSGPRYIGNLKDVGVRVQYTNGWVTEWSQRTAATGFLRYERLGNEMSWEVNALAIFNRSISPILPAQAKPQKTAIATSVAADEPPASLAGELKCQVQRAGRGLYEAAAAICVVLQLVWHAATRQRAGRSEPVAAKVPVVTLASGQRAWDFAAVAGDEPVTSPQPPASKPVASPQRPPLLDLDSEKKTRKKRKELNEWGESPEALQGLRRIIDANIEGQQLKDPRSVEELRLKIIEQHGPRLTDIDLTSDRGKLLFHAWALHCSMNATKAGSARINSSKGCFIHGLYGGRDKANQLWYERVSLDQRKLVEKWLHATEQRAASDAIQPVIDKTQFTGHDATKPPPPKWVLKEKERLRLLEQGSH